MCAQDHIFNGSKSVLVPELVKFANTDLKANFELVILFIYVIHEHDRYGLLDLLSLASASSTLAPLTLPIPSSNSMDTTKAEGEQASSDTSTMDITVNTATSDASVPNSTDTSASSSSTTAPAQPAKSLDLYNSAVIAILTPLLETLDLGDESSRILIGRFIIECPAVCPGAIDLLHAAALKEESVVFALTCLQFVLHARSGYRLLGLQAILATTMSPVEAVRVKAIQTVTSLYQVCLLVEMSAYFNLQWNAAVIVSMNRSHL
jgi:hypothetical protein